MAMDFYTRIFRAKNFIDNHYATPIDLAKLSNEACFSKFHFLRLFKKTYRKTPYQYLTEIRLDKAKERLAKSNEGIADVCNAVGFESITSFTLKFKSYTGTPPALFRLRALQRQKISREQPQRVIPHCFSFMFSAKESNS